MASKQDSKKQSASSEKATASESTQTSASKAIETDAGAADITQELASLSELFQGDPERHRPRRRDRRN